MANLPELRNKRGTKRTKLTKLLKEIDEAQPGPDLSIETVIVQRESLEVIIREYTQVADAIAGVCSDASDQTEYAEYDDRFMADYRRAKVELLRRERAATPLPPQATTPGEHVQGDGATLAQLGTILGRLAEHQERLTTHLVERTQSGEGGASTSATGGSPLVTILDKLVHQQSELAQRGNSAAAGLHGAAQSITVNHSQRLPPLTLKKFDGEFRSWPEFEDLFTATVINNTTLSDGERLSYLKSVTTGSAHDEIKNFKISAANFTPAWTRLKNRFKRDKFIIDSIVSSFYDQSSIAKPTATGLRSLLQKSQETIDSLKALATFSNKADSRDPWLINALLRKVDGGTREKWASHIVGKDNLTFDELLTFLQGRCESLEASQSLRATEREQRPIRAHVADSECCLHCSGTHRLIECPTFRQLTVADKRVVVQEKRLCYNCLRSGHTIANCSSKSGCRKCRKRHNTLLCPGDGNSSRGNAVSANFSSADDTTSSTIADTDVESDTGHSSGEETIVATVAQPTAQSTSSLLPTALVSVVDRFGRRHRVSCLLDSGSQASFVSEALAQKLQLDRNQARLNVSGIGGKHAGMTRGRVVLEISPRHNQMEVLTVPALVLPKLTSFIPNRSVALPETADVHLLHLADPDFQLPKRIDVVLGSEILFKVIRGGKAFPWGRSGPIAIETSLGWLISGQTGELEGQIIASAATFRLEEDETTLEQQLKAFWETEEVGAGQTDTAAERVSINDSDIFSRAESGRFVAKLPTDESTPELGESLGAAIACLKSMERRFSAKPDLKEKYVQFIREYQQLGHMERVPEDEVQLPVSKICYLPHHDVHNEGSTTTKLRVVFNASKKTSSGASLNSRLIVGPTIQRDLVSILLGFRLHRFVATGDIEKMYRQISVPKADADLQRIVWRESPDKPIEHWRLVTVVYGTASASYCATRPLQLLAQEHRQSHPKAAEVIEKGMYVDDCHLGGEDIDDVVQTQQDVVEILRGACLPLRKWAANHPKLLESIAPDHREMEPQQLDFGDHTRKTLGIIWHPKPDTFTYTVKIAQHEIMTKRKYLSETSKLFDPFGWISPVIVGVKIRYQQLWRADVDWDDILPDDVRTNWDQFVSEAPQIERISIPRWVPNAKQELELYGFADASMLAYAAVIYARTVDEAGAVHIRLLMSKTKVAPIKPTTIPRLELCAALLLSRLAEKVWAAIAPMKPKFHAFSDSTTVLAWLSAHPRRWNTYVSNRCGEILEKLPRSCWRHISGVDNPADLASRGVSPTALLDAQLWWQGPPWLGQSKDIWPTHARVENDQAANQEARPGEISIFVVQPEDGLFVRLQQRFSSFQHLLRVTALIIRFTCNTRPNKFKRMIGPLSGDELMQAEKFHIKASQSLHYAEEIGELSKRRNIGSKSKILSLDPILDADGILRVGGRLQHANLTFGRKHPIVLHADSTFARLLIDYYHLKHLHAGPTLLINLLRTRYWLPRSRALVRKLCHKCLVCFKQKANQRPTTQKMGSLPSPRINIQPRCFVHVGVDYAGPIKVRPSSGRGNTTIKGYICLFICLASRAIHLECATDLTSAAFLRAFKRFMARRGHPENIYSDCGTNFTGAVPLLNANKEAAVAELNVDEITRELASWNITWHFNPPSAPHMGGIWEAGVKSSKHHLHRVLQDQVLTFEEYSTVLAEIESCLNSRPLCPLNEDPSSLDALTPGHLLNLEPPRCLPEPTTLETPLNRLDHYALLRRIVEEYWRRWSVEYVASLQPRIKWQRATNNLRIGDLVLVREDNSPPSLWVTARVIALHPGKDDIVRVVTVRHRGGEMKRPVTKLARLPID